MDRNWYSAKILECITVALRKESVDRNENGGSEDIKEIVALRKESVDRNTDALYDWGQICKSLSARRAWIEIAEIAETAASSAVALRKESVDRNIRSRTLAPSGIGRSPQGERG